MKLKAHASQFKNNILVLVLSIIFPIINFGVLFENALRLFTL